MKENKYLKQTVQVPILFALFITIVIVIISNYNFKDISSKRLDQQKNDFIKKEKELSKQKIENIFKYIKHISTVFPNNIKKQKELVSKFIKDENDLKRYIFVLNMVDLKGGDKFAKMFINSNRPELIGKYLNDSYKDSKGKEFRKIFLKDIRESGESFVTYHYNKLNSKDNIEKISYFKYHKKFAWIIGTGIYIDEINKDIKIVEQSRRHYIYKESLRIIIFSIITIIILGVILYIIMNKLKKVIKLKDHKIKNNIKQKIVRRKEIKKHRDILQTVVNIQKNIISSKDFNSSVEYLLKEILKIINVDRVYIFENNIVNKELVCSQKFEYTKKGISKQIKSPQLQNVPYSDNSIKRWNDILSTNNSIEGHIKDFPESERYILETQNIKSILVMPIFYENKFWGFVGFDDCSTERIWNYLEKDALKIIINSFVEALIKDNDSKLLEQKVKTQIDDIRKKDSILIQQSKMASLGEMIGNIAHQWRQPLNIIGSSVMSLQLKYENNLLDDKFINNYVNNINTTIQDMSSTIDDFRKFFLPNKEKIDFNVKDIILETLTLIDDTFKTNNINITINTQDNCILNGYRNEFSQVIMVILNNSKDAIINNNISNGLIDIDITKKNSLTKINILDNGGGIKENILNKVFEPYFTTKFKSRGTGISLFMAKEIIENNMNGVITIENYKKINLDGTVCNGAMVSIKFDKSDDKQE